MGAAGLEIPGHVDVVRQIVLVALGVEDVAGVADGRLAHRAPVVEHRLHGRVQVLGVVEAVEDAEDVHAVLDRTAHEALDHVVGIVGVAHGVGAAQQHLEADVGDALAQLHQALPGILVEEAHAGVEGGPAPHLE